MNRAEATLALQRAVAISRELAELADAGDVCLTPSLDAERLQLLKSARNAAHPMGDIERLLLREVAELNDRAIGFLEHRRRRKARELEMVTVGQRALRAYSANGSPRG